MKIRGSGILLIDKKIRGKWYFISSDVIEKLNDL